MTILLVEPFYAGSHRNWAMAYQKYSKHEVWIHALKGRHWKWRMYGGAVELAKQFDQLAASPDLILATDMLDLTTYLALLRQHLFASPIALYFHENQITYPWSPNDQDVQLNRNNQYGFINYTSALAADQLFFNSAYHRQSFLKALPRFLKQFPDYQGLNNIPSLVQKSRVLHLGLELTKLDQYRLEIQNEVPILLWNHRWEYDKNPEDFFAALFRLKEENIDYQLVVIGEAYQKTPAIFATAKEKLADRLLHFGYVEAFSDYAHWLWKADILPVSSQQDFFGASVVEAIYCQCIPLLPRRLAYPEHLPKGQQQNHYYDSNEQFYQLLKYWIQLPASERKAKHGQNFVAPYDWSNLAQHYDRVFQQMVEQLSPH
ncbi:MAG: DUF3524 domain-containing protein [Bacteroidota bacterium]